MSYFLGVDLGTTYTAAAILRDGRTTTVDLGNHGSTIPTVVFLREDETVLTGEAASRRGTTDPTRVAREFKRRVGDTTPILLGGSPYSADALMGKLLRWVVDATSEREGAPPAGIAVTHPANWGPYKKDLLEQAVVRADLDRVTTISEPEAAVTYYASQERIEPGSVIAVYDLGGGTFDAAVVRKTAGGVELLGSPEGIERLGGVDFDEAVFSHVTASLAGALEQLDPDDPAAMAAVMRLRADCTDAKEALSADTEVSIPVLLPNVSTEVRLTRAEFEAMIRPPLADSITAVRRALRTAQVEPEDLHAVLLAGGSSRIPLVAQMVGSELGRPVAVDAHPKHGVAYGAALAAAAAAGVDSAASAGGQRPAAPAAPAPPPGAVVGLAAGAVGAGAVAAGSAAAAGQGTDVTATSPATTASPGLAPGSPASPAGPRPAEPTRQVRVPAPVPPPPAAGHAGRPGPQPRADGATGAPPAPAPGPEPAGRDRRGLLAVGGLVAVAAVAIAAFALVGRDGADPSDASDSTETAASPDPTEIQPEATTPQDEPSTPQDEDPGVIVPPEDTPVCPPERPLCIEMHSVAIEGDSLVIDWTPVGFTPSTGDHHAHFFWSTTMPTEAGTNAANFGATPGVWELTDARPFVSQDQLRLSQRPPAATDVCVTVADSSHGVVDPEVFHCLPVPL